MFPLVGLKPLRILILYIFVVFGIVLSHCLYLKVALLISNLINLIYLSLNLINLSFD